MLARGGHFNIRKIHLKLPSTQNVCYDIESFECVLVRSSNEKALRHFLQWNEVLLFKILSNDTIIY